MNFGKTIKINNGYTSLEEERFVTVNDHENNDSEWDYNIDLKDKRYFGDLQVVDIDKTYGLHQGWSGEDAFKSLVNDELSIFKYLKLSNKDIKKANYTIEKNIESVLNQNELKEKFPSDFEAQYLALKRKLRKVRIKYNKQLLPIKVYGFYEGTENTGWHLLRTISYPYKNKQEFDKKLTDYIKRIKTVESEQEDN